MKIRWKGFELPTGIECDTDSLTATYGSFSIEPFERGFGFTMGNSLRRILLSSIQGCAVYSVQIDGIRCEFENIEGVYEDTTELVMNLKKLYLKIHTDEPVRLILEKEGPGVVTASDIGHHQDVEVINPDLVIATLCDKKVFRMELEANKGRGFVLARENMDIVHSNSSSAFMIDSIYSPVQKVSHRVVKTRVGQKTDYERLELRIWTNGIVTPKEALNEAASIMRKHINPFLSYSSVGRVAKTIVEDEPKVNTQDNQEKLNLPISVLEPSARTRNCLEAEGIVTLGQLVVMSEHDLLKIRNFGQTSLNEIKTKLEAFSLNIGYTEQ